MGFSCWSLDVGGVFALRFFSMWFEVCDRVMSGMLMDSIEIEFVSFSISKSSVFECFAHE